MIKRLTAWLIPLAMAFPLFAQTHQGIALFEAGRLEEAQRVLSAASSDPQAMVYLGRIAIEQNDPDRAIDLLEKAVAKRPSVGEVHYWLAEAYGSAAVRAGFFRQAGLARKAKAELETAISLDPANNDARMRLIDFYTLAPSILGGSTDKALAEAAEIRKRDGLLGHRAFATVFIRQKKIDLARKEYQEAVAEHPASAMAHTWLGSFYGLNDKNIKAGFDEIATAMKVDPSYMPAYFRFGHLAARSGANLAHAEEPLRKYLAHRPRYNEPDLASAHYYLGMVYEKLGRRKDALQSYSAATKLNPAVRPFSEAVKRLSSQPQPR